MGTVANRNKGHDPGPNPGFEWLRESDCAKGGKRVSTVSWASRTHSGSPAVCRERYEQEEYQILVIGSL